mmetsp:Transcript_22688/g.48656  ORF Transcript_22688/g.48656 Transcript_22688/m.48656 type:complete len:85 (+) Transcript_22688:236-490(+)|eukprot:scaffold257934_cov26-Tisochrysis_lutea.AAC.4
MNPPGMRLVYGTAGAHSHQLVAPGQCCRPAWTQLALESRRFAGDERRCTLLCYFVDHAYGCQSLVECFCAVVDVPYCDESDALV